MNTFTFFHFIHFTIYCFIFLRICRLTEPVSKKVNNTTVWHLFFLYLFYHNYWKLNWNILNCQAKQSQHSEWNSLKIICFPSSFHSIGDFSFFIHIYIPYQRNIHTSTKGISLLIHTIIVRVHEVQFIIYKVYHWQSRVTILLHLHGSSCKFTFRCQQRIIQFKSWILPALFIFFKARIQTIFIPKVVSTNGNYCALLHAIFVKLFSLKTLTIYYYL